MSSPNLPPHVGDQLGTRTDRVSAAELVPTGTLKRKSPLQREAKNGLKSGAGEAIRTPDLLITSELVKLRSLAYRSYP